MTLLVRLSCFAALLINVLQVSAQEMSTPYSVYGLGDFDHRTYNHNSGMGYTGLALKTTLFSSGNNPASIAGLQKSFFTMDISGASRFVTYTGNSITPDNSSNRDFTIKKLGLSTKVTSFWGSGVGFKQLSSVNYSFTTSKSIEGTNSTYAVNYSGDGGLNEIYWNNAFSLGKHLSVGVNSSYITGSINQTASLTAATDTAISGKRQDAYGHTKLEFGAIYTASLDKNWELGLGASFGNAAKLASERTLALTDNTTRLSTQTLGNYTGYSLPGSYGAGLSLSSKSGRTFAVDYAYHDWSSLNIRGDGWHLVSSQRISAGAEFARFTVDQFGRNIRKKAFQMGAYVNNSYLQVQNHQISEYGVTGGFSSSSRTGMLYTISAEGGVRGTTSANLIKENFIQLTFSLSFREFLYSQGHKYN